MDVASNKKSVITVSATIALSNTDIHTMAEHVWMMDMLSAVTLLFPDAAKLGKLLIYG